MTLRRHFHEKKVLRTLNVGSISSLVFFFSTFHQRFGVGVSRLNDKIAAFHGHRNPGPFLALFRHPAKTIPQRGHAIKLFEDCDFVGVNRLRIEIPQCRLSSQR